MFYGPDITLSKIQSHLNKGRNWGWRDWVDNQKGASGIRTPLSGSTLSENRSLLYQLCIEQEGLESKESKSPGPNQGEACGAQP